MGTAGRPHLCAASGCPVGRPAPATRWAGRGCAPGVRPRPASGRQGRVVTACEGREEGTPSSPPLCPAPLHPLSPRSSYPGPLLHPPVVLGSQGLPIVDTDNNSYFF